ncbi:MAG: hypothetical protein HC819_08630 [Cyclobacteriaceae bacterium]|nr:hypothetical protein [Cyclobacteriaceae bacterium]
MTEDPHKQQLNFVTLKVAGALSQSELPYGIFDHREFCDQFVRAIIYCVEHYHLQVYGFVIISDQIHLIVSADSDKLAEKIQTLKNLSAEEIISQLGKKSTP